MRWLLVMVGVVALAASTVKRTEAAASSGTPPVVALGRRLFFDPVLSIDHSIACASCHRPELGFSDGYPVAQGVGGQRGTRNTPSLLNASYQKFFFWDGRETVLERQVLMPISNHLEMDVPAELALERLRSDEQYRAAFAKAFPDGVTLANLAECMAAYVRTIRSGNSPVDQFIAGDENALSPEARRGYELFRGKASCSGCHEEPYFADGDFHNTGASWGGADKGRQAVTNDAQDCGKFRTPMLRDVARTAPYMHDGSKQTLDEVLEFYNQGGVSNPCLDMRVRPLHLSRSELNDLKSFLQSLSGTVAEGK
jgi:cytochrome c peroxidase